MATTSFDREVLIKDDKTAKILCNVINRRGETRLMKESKKINIDREIAKGEKRLNKYCSPSKPSSK